MANNLASLQDAPPSTESPKLLTLLAAPAMKTRLAAAAGKLIDPTRMLALVAHTVRKNPKILLCNTESVIGAMMASAALGLEPNTPQQQAFLIPYKTRKQVDGRWTDVYECQFQIGARGYVTLAYRSGYVESLQAEGVHEHDLFEHMQGTETFLRFAKTLRDPGELIGAFCYTRFKGGGEVATVLPMAEIHRSRARSETYKALVAAVNAATNDKDRAKAEKNLLETPWVASPESMAAKTAIKKHSKRLPIQAGDHLAAALALDEAPNASVFADPDVLRQTIETGLEPLDGDHPDHWVDDEDENAPPPWAAIYSSRQPAVEIPTGAPSNQAELLKSEQQQAASAKPERRRFGAE